jgi:hypothetical protein
VQQVLSGKKIKINKQTKTNKMKKTLGGDRIGSGKKMQVELKNYERSTHDLGYLFRTTQSAGTLVPFLSELALPGDTFDINLNCDIKTHPTVGPLFGSYKVQLDVFEAPIRLYQGQLHNNKLGIGMKMSEVYLPQIRLTAYMMDNGDVVKDLDNSQVNPSCLLAYFGIRGVGYVQPDGDDHYTRDFNGIPLLAYWDIYKNYYSNKQEEIGAVIHSPTAGNVTSVLIAKIGNPNWPAEEVLPFYPPVATDQFIITRMTYFTFTYPTSTPANPDELIIMTDNGDYNLNQIGTNFRYTPSGSNTILTADYNLSQGERTTTSWRYSRADEIETKKPTVATFPLSNIDDMREQILAHSTNPAPFVLNVDTSLTPYTWVCNPAGSRVPTLNNQEGLAVKTYQSDLFNNWLQTEWIDGPNGITAVTAIDTSGGSFTIDQLNLSKKVYDMLNRIAVSGGTYDDWLDVTYMHDRITRAESPIYHGGLIKELVFQEVVSNSAAGGDNGEQPLGTLAGKGVLAQKHKGGSVTIRVNEPSYLIGLISLTPRIDYSQGNKWDIHLKTMDDFHKPQLDEIGFQELITEQMAWWDTTRNSTTWITKSAGKQPAWINYMTAVNRVLGNFAIPDNEMFMTLNRRYEPNWSTSDTGVLNGVKDLTTYIDPAKFNHIFAETSIDAQNFWTQIAVDITARRKMSARIMPNL